MHRILIIDDEETLTKNIKDFLEAKGYAASMALDAKAGIDLVKKNDPHLLILDLHLKDGVSGEQILRASKMLKPSLKVIMLTGFGEEEAARKSCMELGASAFLSKPTSLKNLAEAIENTLKQT